MPIYEFRCSPCGHEFERLQKVSDPDPKKCPECGALKLVRVISPVGFRLKGGGWYETDFKKSDRRNVAEAEKGAADKGDKKEKEKSETKTAEKTEKKQEPKKRKDDGKAVA